MSNLLRYRQMNERIKGLFYLSHNLSHSTLYPDVLKMQTIIMYCIISFVEAGAFLIFIMKWVRAIENSLLISKNIKVFPSTSQNLFIPLSSLLSCDSNLVEIFWFYFSWGNYCCYLFWKQLDTMSNVTDCKYSQGNLWKLWMNVIFRIAGSLAPHPSWTWSLKINSIGIKNIYLLFLLEIHKILMSVALVAIRRLVVFIIKN